MGGLLIAFPFSLILISKAECDIQLNKFIAEQT